MRPSTCTVSTRHLLTAVITLNAIPSNQRSIEQEAALASLGPLTVRGVSLAAMATRPDPQRTLTEVAKLEPGSKWIGALP